MCEGFDLCLRYIALFRPEVVADEILSDATLTDAYTDIFVEFYRSAPEDVRDKIKEALGLADIEDCASDPMRN